MKAIRAESVKNAKAVNINMVDQPAPGRPKRSVRAISVDGTMQPTDETVPIFEPLVKKTASGNEKYGVAPVTWRERLGGFLHPRDMRKLVTPFSASNEPELIVRRHVMLLNFDHLRAIILRDRVIVLVPDGADSLLVQLEKRIRGESHSMNTEQSSGIADSDDSPLLNISDAVQSFSELSQDTTYLGQAGEVIRDALDNEWADLDANEWIDLPFELQSVDAVLSSVSASLADDVLDVQLWANAIISDLVEPNSDVGERAQEALRTLRRHEAARRHRARSLDRSENPVDGRAVLRARCADPRHAAGRGAPHLPGDRADRVHDHP